MREQEIQDQLKVQQIPEEQINISLPIIASISKVTSSALQQDLVTVLGAILSIRDEDLLAINRVLFEDVLNQYLTSKQQSQPFWKRCLTLVSAEETYQEGELLLITFARQNKERHYEAEDQQEDSKTKRKHESNEDEHEVKQARITSPLPESEAISNYKEQLGLDDESIKKINEVKKQAINEEDQQLLVRFRQHVYWHLEKLESKESYSQEYWDELDSIMNKIEKLEGGEFEYDDETDTEYITPARFNDPSDDFEDLLFRLGHLFLRKVPSESKDFLQDAVNNIIQLTPAESLLISLFYVNFSLVKNLYVTNKKQIPFHVLVLNTMSSLPRDIAQKQTQQSEESTNVAAEPLKPASLTNSQLKFLQAMSTPINLDMMELLVKLKDIAISDETFIEKINLTIALMPGLQECSEIYSHVKTQIGRLLLSITQHSQNPVAELHTLVDRAIQEFSADTLLPHLFYIQYALVKIVERLSSSDIQEPRSSLGLLRYITETVETNLPLRALVEQHIHENFPPEVPVNGKGKQKAFNWQ